MVYKDKKDMDNLPGLVFRPISNKIVLLLNKIKIVSPNSITVFSLIFAITISYFLSQKKWDWGLLIPLLMLVDYLDGGLARIRNESSLSGGYLDGVFDVLKFLLILIGYIIGINSNLAYLLGLVFISARLMIIIVTVKDDVICKQKNDSEINNSQNNKLTIKHLVKFIQPTGWETLYFILFLGIIFDIKIYAIVLLVLLMVTFCIFKFIKYFFLLKKCDSDTINIR